MQSHIAMSSQSSRLSAARDYGNYPSTSPLEAVWRCIKLIKTENKIGDSSALLENVAYLMRLMNDRERALVANINKFKIIFDDMARQISELRLATGDRRCERCQQFRLP